MAVQISDAEGDTVVRAIAKAGKPMPASVAANPRLRRVFEAAQPTPAGTVPPGKPAPAAPSTRNKRAAAPAARAARRDTGGTPPAPRPATAGRPHSSGRHSRRGGASSPRPAGPVPLPRALTKAAGGSPVGGLFLAIFLYPIALAVFTNGPAGFTMWLKAKFLNTTAIGKQTGGFWSHTVKPDGTPAAPSGTAGAGVKPGTGPTAGGAAPGASSSAANAPASVFAPGWADMMKNRQRVSA